LTYCFLFPTKEWMSAQTREALICQTGRDLDECSRMQRQFGQLQRRVLGPEPDVTGQLIEASFDRRPELRLSQSAACAELATAGALPPLPDGPEKLLRAIQTCRQLIALRHSDSPRIALWQGRLAEDWQDLRELLNTRGELLRAAGNRLLFFRRCEDVTQDLLDKLTLLPSIIGPDKETLDKQQRQLASFQWDIEAMGEGVNWVLMATEVLLPQFAGEQAEEMKTKKQRMLDVWQKLNQTMEQHHRLLTEASALDKWLADWMHFLNWALLTRKNLEVARTLRNYRLGSAEQDCNASLTNMKEISQGKVDHLELWREILTRKASLVGILQDGCRLRDWIHRELEVDEDEAKATLSSLEALIWNSVRSIEVDPNFPISFNPPETVKCLPNPNPLSMRKAAVECLFQRSASATNSMDCEMSLLLVEFFFIKFLWKQRMEDLNSLMKCAEVLRQIHSLEVWMTSMEKVLQTDNLGNDLYETLTLSDEHQKICDAMFFQEERIRQLAQMNILQADDDKKEWLERAHAEFTELLQQHGLWQWPISPTEVVPENAQQDLQSREENQILFGIILERKEGILYRWCPSQTSTSRSRVTKWRKQFVVLSPDSLSLQFLDLPEMCETRRVSRVKRGKHDEFLLSDGLSAKPVEAKTRRRGYTFMLHAQRRGENSLLKATSKDVMAGWVSAINRASKMATEAMWTDAKTALSNTQVELDQNTIRRRWYRKDRGGGLSTQASCLPFGSFCRNRQFPPSNLSADEKTGERNEEGTEDRDEDGDTDDGVDKEEVKENDDEENDEAHEKPGRRDRHLRSLLKLGRSTMLSSLSDSAEASSTIMTLTLPLRAFRRRIQRFSLDRGTSASAQLSQTPNNKRLPLHHLLTDSAQEGSTDNGNALHRQGQQNEDDADDGETDIDMIDEFS
uniref:PH domain-containing protein n=1 Tax=Schistocephalus solidus TaxID=70667 RepID=A0A183SWE4_SCHSO